MMAIDMTVPRAAEPAVMLQERARIARELHDSVGQTLYAIGLTASRALLLVEPNEQSQVQAMIDDVLQLANSGQSELRLLLANIRSDLLTRGGLTEGLSKLATDVQARHGVDVRLAVAGEPEIPVAIKDAIILITREALQNAVRHAQAGRIDIVVQGNAGGIALTIADNGRGFDPSIPRPGHFGLQTMRERAAAVGGTLELHSARGLGAHIRVYVPTLSSA
jgi:signal transduction histidine kinase